MPRPREFDETAVLEAALQCFWRRGFEATSVRDLTEAMGLTAPSLYNAFGDKRVLFNRALDHYLEHTTRDRLRRLEASRAPKTAVRQLFAEIIDHSIKDRDHKGCFLVNSALEVAPHQADCRAVVSDQLRDIIDFFKRCIRAGQADGTINADLSVDDGARLLLGLLVGLRVLARIGQTRAVLQGVVRPALALLDRTGQPVKREKR